MSLSTEHLDYLWGRWIETKSYWVLRLEMWTQERDTNENGMRQYADRAIKVCQDALARLEHKEEQCSDRVKKSR